MPDIIQHYYESDVYRRGSYSDLTHEIALVRKEIEAADNLFQNASDPDLIDSYIFQGNAARKRYSFLIKQAKRLSPSVSRQKILPQLFLLRQDFCQYSFPPRSTRIVLCAID